LAIREEFGAGGKKAAPESKIGNPKSNIMADRLPFFAVSDA
jgi:hypothetical protein